jgi:hypothetical protein
MLCARRPIPVSSHNTEPICCGFLIVAMSVLRSPSRMPRLHSYRLSMSGASPMLNSALSPTCQTTFTFGSPDLTVEDAQPYLLLAQSFGHCSLQRALVAYAWHHCGWPLPGHQLALSISQSETPHQRLRLS